MDPLYLIGFGQSNMVGGADSGLNSLMWDPTSPDSAVKVWNPATRAWEVAHIDPGFPASTGLDRGSNMAWHAALELHARSGRPVRLFLDAHGGTPIDGVGPEGTGWIGAGPASEHYAALATQIIEAGAPRIDLAIFAQGEENFDDAPAARTAVRDAESYRVAVETLVSQLRSETWFGSTAPFIMPELVPGSGRDDRNDVIRSLSVDDDPATDVAYAVQPFEEVPEIGISGIHWSVNGHPQMGVRVVEAYERAAKAVGWDPFAYADFEDPFARPVDLRGSAAHDRIAGNAGHNMIDARSGRDTVDGGLGRDWIRGGTGDDDLNGGGNADIIEGGGGFDRIGGGAGHDRLRGNSGCDTIEGGAGDDRIEGGGSADLLLGGSGADQLWGAEGSDTLVGGNGHDELRGNFGHDFLDGGAGNDLLSGGLASDTLVGGIGGDRLLGGRGDDLLIGGRGADALRGGPGNDRLDGGRGPDILVGGVGADTFVFATATGSDIIVDFEPGIDAIVLEGIADAPVRFWSDGSDLKLGIADAPAITLSGLAGVDVSNDLEF